MMAFVCVDQFFEQVQNTFICFYSDPHRWLAFFYKLAFVFRFGSASIPTGSLSSLSQFRCSWCDKAMVFFFFTRRFLHIKVNFVRKQNCVFNQHFVDSKQNFINWTLFLCYFLRCTWATKTGRWMYMGNLCWLQWWKKNFDLSKKRNLDFLIIYSMVRIDTSMFSR